MANNIWHYIKNYKLRSIFVNYFGMLLVLLVLPVSVSFFISNYIYDKAFEREILDSNTGVLSQISISMDNIINDITSQLKYMTADNNVLFFMNTINEDDYISYNTNTIRYIMESFHLNFPYIENAHLFSLKSKRVISLHGGGTIDTIEDNSWYHEYNEQKTVPFWITKRNLQDKYNVISICIVVKYFNEDIGLVVANINIESIKPLLFTSNSSFNSLFVFDSYGNLMLSEGNGNVPDFEHIKSLNLSKPYSLITNEKRKNTSTYIKSPTTEWYSVSEHLHNEYSQNLAYTQNIAIIVIVFTFIFSLMLSIVISYRFFVPLKNIISILQSPALIEGHENSIKYRNEMAFITDIISKTIIENSNYESELNNKLNMIKKAQMTSLQAQINPHFLYNTIASIRYLAMDLTGNENAASKALSSLGRLFQISLDGSEHFIEVEKEIDHVKQYLQLQKIRYSGKLECKIDISEEIKHHKVIKIILQPLVENSIYHGIKPANRNGIIKIKGYSQDDKIIFEISDNGVGMNYNTIKSIQKNNEKDDYNNPSHIGIYNVNQRLKLIFGTRYTLDIKSQLDKGTMVKIEMPIL